MPKYYKTYRPKVLYDDSEKDEDKENLNTVSKELQMLLKPDKTVIKLKRNKEDKKPPINTLILLQKLV